jgi:hypothetical protein
MSKKSHSLKNSDYISDLKYQPLILSLFLLLLLVFGSTIFMFSACDVFNLQLWKQYIARALRSELWCVSYMYQITTNWMI